MIVNPSTFNLDYKNGVAPKVGLLREFAIPPASPAHRVWLFLRWKTTPAGDWLIRGTVDFLREGALITSLPCGAAQAPYQVLPMLFLAVAGAANKPPDAIDITLPGSLTIWTLVPRQCLADATAVQLNIAEHAGLTDVSWFFAVESLALPL